MACQRRRPTATISGPSGRTATTSAGRGETISENPPNTASTHPGGGGSLAGDPVDGDAGTPHEADHDSATEPSTDSASEPASEPASDLDHEPDESAAPSRRRRWIGPIERHPLLAVAVVATCVAVGHAVWIATHRRLGAYDPDEAGYIATALRLHRSIDLGRPWLFLVEVGRTGNGPLVPALAVALLIPGARDPRTVMMIQPILLVLCCVSIAGVTRRMAGPLASFATGCAFLALPTAALATQSLWLGLGAAASMGVSMWALLASERCTNRRVYVYGLGMAAMALSRTMALGFVPGLMLAGAVMAGRDRRAWMGLLRSIALAFVVAGPWYVIERESIFGYLFTYGYGPRAGLFGSGGPLQRLEFRYDRISGDVGKGLTWTAAVMVLTVAPIVVWRWRQGRGWPEGTREFLAIAATVGVGLAALVTTTNNGVWFELPLIVLLVALAGAVAARSVLPLRLAMLVQVIGQGGLVLAITWWLITPRLELSAHYEAGFAQYDDRYAPGRRAEQPAAARDWRRLSDEVEQELRRIDGGTGLGAVFTVSGNMQLFNSNTLTLAAELDSWGPRIEIPDTTVARSQRALALTPRTTAGDGRQVERVLVLAIHDKILFTPDAEVRSFERQALDTGWRVVDRFAMPTGGEVRLLRHPGDR